MKELTVIFLHHYLEIDWKSDALKGRFDFSLIDSSLIGTPREKPTIHSVKFVMSDRLMMNWELVSIHNQQVSEDMEKVAFQRVEDYLFERLRTRPFIEGELPPLEMLTTNSEAKCPYNLSNILYPSKKAFTIPIENQINQAISSNPVGGLKAFVSYSTIDKHIAGRVKVALNKIEIPTFLAHDDVPVSQEWRERIIAELSQANVVVLLLSKAFKKSDWAPQEVGMAVLRKDVLLIPLSIDGTVPFGFMSHIQSQSLSNNGIDEEMLVEPMISRWPQEIIPKLIKRLADVAEFRGAETLMLRLEPYFDRFNSEEIDQFVTASIKNNQVWAADDCRKRYIPAFLRLHRGKIDAGKLKALEYRLESGRVYVSS